MRIPRVFVDIELQSGCDAMLDDRAAHYLSRVLRMSAGREVKLFNGDGKEYSASILELGKKHIAVHVSAVDSLSFESPLFTELAIGMSKGDRMEWLIQKAVELGVNAIVPLETTRVELKLKGERLEKRIEQWRQIAISACEQCQRRVVPNISMPLSLDSFVQECNTPVKFVMDHRSDEGFVSEQNVEALSFVVGPEGGLTESEVLSARNHGFKGLALGPRVLRTETAPIVALSIFQNLWGDF